MSETYILVTVTHDGRVSSSAYPSQFAAENAKSIALTGMTLAARTAAQERKDRDRDEWYRQHPYRLPLTDQERQFVSSRTGRVSGGSYSGTSGGYNYSSSFPGMLQESFPFDLTISYGDGSSVVRAVVFKDAGDNHEALNT